MQSPGLIFRTTFLAALLAAPVAADIGFSLTASTDDANATPAFDCTGDQIYKFPFAPNASLPVTGTVQSGTCKLKGPIPLHRAFHLQALTAGGQQLKDVFYNVNTVDGAIAGDALLRQEAVFFNGHSMSYGVSHAAAPITDQAYVYIGSSQERWMEDLQKELPDLRIGELVLPGSHDAGMYVLNVSNVEKAVARLCSDNAALQIICKAGGVLGAITIQNVAMNQKDTAETQLKLGMRFFDFRPAQDDKSNVYHVHNFIPGVSFKQFLSDVDTFLQTATQEVVFLQITHSGINKDQFTQLSQTQVEAALSATISSQVGFTIVDNIAGFNQRLLTDVAGSGRRLIVIYGKTDVNDSYDYDDTDHAYSQSLTDPSSVVKALGQTLAKCSSPSYQYNLLQLQDTGLAALGHYISDISKHPTAWANNIVASGTGSLLQATKPLFDRSTYSWLTSPSALTGLHQCQAPVILLNDFVDPVLASRAEALTRYRNSVEISMHPDKYYLKTVEGGRLVLSYDLNQRVRFHLKTLPGGKLALQDAAGGKYYCLGERNMLFGVGDAPAAGCQFEKIATGKVPNEFALKAANGLYLRRYSDGLLAADDHKISPWNLCYLH